MKYLFYDLEYASQKEGTSKICEFGYVLTDEKFEIIDRNNFIINPKIKGELWDYYALKHILTRTKEEYKSGELFSFYFERIKKLFDEADYVFGHSIDGDAKALNDECKRYNLPSINHTFYDIKIFFKSFKNIKNDISVTNIMKDLNAEGDEKEHDAEADAYNTMIELKVMLEQLDLPLSDLITLCPDARNKSENYEVESIVINNLIRAEKYKDLITDSENNTLRRHSKNRKLFALFIDNVQQTEKCEQDLQDQSITISINYEENHYKQMLNLVQLICNHGGKYVTRASDGTIFVSYPISNEDGTEKYCSKLRYVNEANENGGNIKIMSLEEFLAIFDLNEERLNELPMVSFDCFCRSDAIIKDRKTKSILEAHRKLGNSKIPKENGNNSNE